MRANTVSDQMIDLPAFRFDRSVETGDELEALRIFEWRSANDDSETHFG